MSEAENPFPIDALREGLLVGRIWRGGPIPGPSVALMCADGVYDISDIAPTMSALLERTDLPESLRSVDRAAPLCSIDELVRNSRCGWEAEARPVPFLLAPCDLQAIKACGVTFAVSALERVVEERTRGDARAADAARRAISESVGDQWGRVVPGSGAAADLKQQLVSMGLWSQYLEVALGPDAEVFTKACPMSSVGSGADVGILRSSSWNNPEPEIVLAANSRGESIGATLGNDVNLRDLEGRSALLLGKAKDFNGGCAVGPAIRIFDDTFSLDDVRKADVTLQVMGPEGFRLEERSSMSQISRDPLDLVGQAMGAHHQYPDGMMLFLGTMFAPIQDRDGPGLGFTHRIGDVITIGAAGLGALTNRVGYCDAIPPWTFGIGELMQNLRRRGLLSPAQ